MRLVGARQFFCFGIEDGLERRKAAVDWEGWVEEKRKKYRAGERRGGWVVGFGRIGDGSDLGGIRGAG